LVGIDVIDFIVPTDVFPLNMPQPCSDALFNSLSFRVKVRAPVPERTEAKSFKIVLDVVKALLWSRVLPARRSGMPVGIADFREARPLRMPSDV
jgi:hypothetical protein